MAAHSHHTSEKRLFIALSLTAGFMLLEFIGGLYSGSLALLADAGHMLTDTVALFLAWLAARLAEKPADRLRSYGYQRVQILAAFINGLFFILLVFWIIIEAITRINEPSVVAAKPMLLIAVFGLVINLVVYKILHSTHHNDLNIRAATLHVLGDLLGSVAAISAAIIILITGWMPIDPLLSFLVASLILFSAWKVVKESTHILLEGTPPDVDVKTIQHELMNTIPEVVDVHHIHLWSLSQNKPMMTLHVKTRSQADPNQVLCAVKDILLTKFSLQHTTVQIETDTCVDEHIQKHLK